MIPFAPFYLLACLLLGWAGRRRRFGFVGFFVLSIVLTPIVVAFILFVSAPSEPKPARPSAPATPPRTS
jgi:hypothetical protein